MFFRKFLSFIFIPFIFLITLLGLSSFKKYNNDSINKESILSQFNLNNEETEISNDIKNFKNQKYNNFLFFENNNIYNKAIANHTLNDKVNIRVQYQNVTSENWCDWISNSLNQVNSNISLINFNKRYDYMSLINNKIHETIESIYPKENVYKYRMPRIAKETSGYPYFPEPPSEYQKNTVNIFGTPLKNKNTHRISRYGAYGTNSIYSSHWYYANDIYDTIKYHQVSEIYNFFKIKNSKEPIIKNNSFSLSNFFYKISPATFNTNLWGYSASGGSIRGYINLFDNSNKLFQQGENRNRTFNDWFSSNYSDYQLNNKPNSTKLGNLDILNNISNIDFNFKHLIKINSTTSSFLNEENDIHKKAPKISFTWNTELLKALKESYLIKKNLINYLRKIDINNTSIIYKTNKLLKDIYEYNIDSIDLQSIINNELDINKTDFINEAHYYKILKKYNWEFEAITNNEINNKSIDKKLVFEILNRSLVYEYVIPKVFSNDIWIEYQDENNSTSKYVKVFDAETTKFNDIEVPNPKNQFETLNNIVKFKIKNIFIIHPFSREVVAGSKYSGNPSLNLVNCLNLSNLNRDNIIYDSNTKELWFYFLFNPIEFSQPSIDNETKSLTSLDMLVSDVFNLEKYDLGKITIDSLKIPNEILSKYNDFFSGLIDKTSSFNDPDIKDFEVEKYKDVSNYLIKKNNYWKNKHLFEKDKKVSEDIYLNSKYELDSLGYFYVDLSISFPLNFYISVNDYYKLISNNTIIERGKTITGNYKYWVKYSTNKKPLHIDDLVNFIDINWTNTDNPLKNKLNQIISFLDNYKPIKSYINNYNTIKNINTSVDFSELNNKYKTIINELINQLQIKKHRSYSDWYKPWNKVDLEFNYNKLKSDLLNILIKRNEEIYDYLEDHNTTLLNDIIEILENNNQILTKSYFDLINNINEIEQLETNISKINDFINSQNKYSKLKSVSINFNLDRMLEKSKNNDTISKYWLLNMNSINEFFYVSKETFTNQFNTIINLKTNINLDLRTENLFSYDFKKDSNDYAFKDLSLKYLFTIDSKTNLLNSFSLEFEKTFTNLVNNDILLMNDINLINNKIISKTQEINQAKVENASQLNKIKNSFLENSIINNFALDNNEYFKGFYKELINFNPNSYFIYEINWIFLSLVTVISLTTLIITLVFIIKTIKKRK